MGTIYVAENPGVRRERCGAMVSQSVMFPAKTGEPWNSESTSNYPKNDQTGSTFAVFPGA